MPFTQRMNPTTEGIENTEAEGQTAKPRVVKQIKLDDQLLRERTEPMDAL
jgi:hypothetical protein